MDEKELDKLQTFGKEDDGSYCDRWEFSIIRSGKSGGQWTLHNFCEVNGVLGPIKVLKDMDDLENMYFRLTGKELI